MILIHNNILSPHQAYNDDILLSGSAFKTVTGMATGVAPVNWYLVPEDGNTQQIAQSTATSDDTTDEEDATMIPRAWSSNNSWSVGDHALET
jgi:hypothetical protein